MSNKLKEALWELPTLTKEELIYKRHTLSIERAKIESKLLELEYNERQRKEIDPDLYRRTEFALKATGIVIAAIDSELGIRKTKNRMTFHEAFYKVVCNMVEDEDSYGGWYEVGYEDLDRAKAEARSRIGETNEK